ncbi:hypothetical protein CsSME_00002480 [Camellia sinensis var. sinensis]
MGASMILAALAVEAGLPDGVLNIVHGTNEIVNYICDDDDIKAVSFVGPSTSIGLRVISLNGYLRQGHWAGPTINEA